MAYVGETTYFANKGTLTISCSGATTTFAVVKDVEVTVSADHVPLYGWGSIKRVAVARHSAKVSVKIGAAKFGLNTGSGPSLPFWIVSPSAGAVTSSMEDTNTVRLFTLTWKFVGEDAGTVQAVVSNVYFPNFPLKATEGQWMQLNLDGEGSDIAFSNP